MTRRDGEGPVDNWQTRGYRMEDSPCEHAVPINDQNDTGYQPVRTDGNWGPDPFGDGAVDERLREQRSQDVEARESQFWVGRDKAPDEAVVERENASRNADRWQPKQKWSVNKKIFLTLALVLVLAMAGLAVYINLHYRIRQIRVEGNVIFTERAVIDASGVKTGTNFLDLKRETVEETMKARNHYLRLISTKWVEPGTLVMTVRERKKVAYITYNGIVCTLDNRGMVLEENVAVPRKKTLAEQVQDQDAGRTENTPDPLAGLVRVEGLSVHYCRRGRILELYDQSQLAVYVTAFTELQVMGLADSVEVLYVTDRENLYLATRDGYSVRLGSADDIHPKLRSMTLTISWLRENGKTGGTIDVSNPEEPTWIPETTGT